MKFEIKLPRLTSVNELAYNVASPPAPRIYKQSNSLVSLMEKIFNVNQQEEDSLPSAEEIEDIENEREEMFRTLANRSEVQFIDGIAAGAIIGTGLTVATALGGAPITAAVIFASVAEFTAFAGAPGPSRKSATSLSQVELTETVIA